ncbi:uncharacterized protein DUF2484 [Aliiruegeria haliotis]|uniref:Uncharacterized protein DUF2484 n=1 Tax=Aliiruegeria haliotis TaxID=1280846 RepID=A0A2T0RXU8_9RHOB|nr:DUF2484 family protein [Aliiruegeria haliotis]PRY26005.1 uncharacterized protein DUF2484 [Aliiruegeria haliotis]
MSYSIVLACLWALAATVIAMIPSRRRHWPQAYVLIAIGIPLLGYVTYENGPLAGLVVFVAGASILRWPLIYLWRWVKRQFGTSASKP